MPTTYIRTSNHTVKFANPSKQLQLRVFVNEYRRIAQEIINHIWTHGYSWTDKKNQTHTFNPNTNNLHSPSFIDYNQIPISDTFLTARALSSLVAQLAGMISAACEKQRKRLYQLDKLKSSGVPKAKLQKLIKKIKTNIPQEPNTKNMQMELSSKCTDWVATTAYFDGYLRIKSFSKIHGHIKLPVNFHRHSNRLASKGSMMSSYLINTKGVDIRWKIEKPEIKKTGTSIGVDQGMNDLLTCSDGFTTPKTCIHGHSLSSIMAGMSRKKKGSKAFKKALDPLLNIVL